MASRTADGADCVTAFALPERRPAAETIDTVAAVARRILRMISSSSFLEAARAALFWLRYEVKRESHFIVPALKLKLPEFTVGRLFISRSCVADGNRRAAQHEIYKMRSSR
jgi:hypothetical protein